MFQISPATAGDFEDLTQLRAEATSWLAGRGLDQWQRPWPSWQGERARVLANIENGDAWLVRDGPLAIATFTIDTFADPRLWTTEERAEQALYIHRFTVSRAHAGIGLGAQIMKLIEVWAVVHGYRWLRVDVWTTNTGLHDYYRKINFDHVRTIAGDYPSGALFQRRVSRPSC